MRIISSKWLCHLVFCREAYFSHASCSIYAILFLCIPLNFSLETGRVKQCTLQFQKPGFIAALCFCGGGGGCCCLCLPSADSEVSMTMYDHESFWLTSQSHKKPETSWAQVPHPSLRLPSLHQQAGPLTWNSLPARAAPYGEPRGERFSTVHGCCHKIRGLSKSC